MKVDPGDPINIGPADFESVVEKIEEILGDDLWGMRTEYGDVSDHLVAVERAVITFDGDECVCCGNQGGSVDFYSASGSLIWSFEFSD